MEKKIKILALFFILFSLILVISGILYQLQERKKQILCQANLRHWGTAFHLYYYSQNEQWQLAPKDTRENWMLKVRNSLYDSHTRNCPSAPGLQYSYKVNNLIVPDHSSTVIKKFPEYLVLFFDGEGKDHYFTGSSPRSEIKNRHLGGSNLLFIDGRVEYKNAHSLKIAAGETGWKESGGYLWSWKPDKY